MPYPRVDVPPLDDSEPGGLVRLALLAVIGGALAGLVGGLFRWALVRADLLRADLQQWAGDEPAVRWLVPVLCAAIAVGLARLIVRWAPEASGSGVQRVEANMRGELDVAPLRILPAKFVGGVLAIGAGLALGREGPTVQMGATIGHETARRARLSQHDRRTLTAALAGAGLGVAFSAPLGGAMFVFEEVAHAFRTRLVIATLVGTTTALAVSGLIVGVGPVLPVPAVEAGPAWHLLAYAALGVLLGAMGVLYNRLVLLLLDAVAGIRRLPPEAVAAVVGGLVGLLGLIAPRLVGGGEALNEELLVGSFSLGALAIILAVRWFLGPVSYSLGTPGGLFAPLLVVGAAAGSLAAQAANALVPGLALSPLAFAIVGMSTFFAAVVRAPITGVILIVEMTATTALVIPMLIAAATAVVAATLLRGPPVYDSLRKRLRS
ncbi:MAG: ClC family H(+)/Cl(-) exchange transporter [Actinobacteria bacterium]|jgi:CIC family chloride channel protein|nr:ClC family H(+)/Cl(-) exchange transporter [Actinomycetota bacterium]